MSNESRPFEPTDSIYHNSRTPYNTMFQTKDSNWEVKNVTLKENFESTKMPRP